MSQPDFDRQMSDYYRDQDDDHAPDRLAERIESIPDIELHHSNAPHRWRQQLGRWLGHDDGDMRSADARGRSRPTKDGRNRIMIAAGTATAVALMALGVAFVGGDLADDGVSKQLVVDTAFTAENPPGPDDFMRAAPVTVTVCGIGVASEGLYFEEETEDGNPIYQSLGTIELSRWESSGSLYGEDDPRLAGTATRVRNEGSGTTDGLRYSDVGLSAFHLANDSGSWEGASTSFVRGREPERSSEMLILEGRDGYEGLTAMLEFPAIDEEVGGYPDCFELYGVIIESGMPGMPEPYRGDAEALEPIEYPIGTVFVAEGFLPFEETGFALAPGTWTIEIMNMSDDERAFIIEDPSGNTVAGAPDELIPPGETWSYGIEVEGSGEGYVMYDPADREATEVIIPAG